MSELNDQPADNSGQQEPNNRPDNRFKDLSDKYAKEAEARKAEAEARAKAEREVEFYRGFTPLTSKYQSAGEFQDKIKDKVMAGYDVEDATIAVLAKEGKYGMQVAPEPVRSKESPTGGSATTTIRRSEKTMDEMTTAEKREELIRLERETGGLSNLFNRTL